MNIFLNLASTNFLVEYIYGDEIINTTTAPFNFIENGHNNEPILLNDDGAINITSNVRARAVAEIDSIASKYAYLTPNKLGPAYNDYDPELTDSASMPLVFGSTEGIIYDTIRIHLIQGFSFSNDFQAIDLNVKVQDKTGKKINLLSAAYVQGDSYEIANPKPLLYSGRQYATYVEYKVPSLKYLIDSYNIDYVQGSNSDILAYKITDGNGFYQNTLIEIGAGKFKPQQKINNQLYTNLSTFESTSISAQDEFDEVGVFIGESTDGDFIEFYGTSNGDIFGDYMQNLNNSGTGQYIAIHQLIITEQIPNTLTGYNLIGNYNPTTNTPNLGATAFITQFQGGDYWVATETAYVGDLSLNVNKGDFMIYNPALPSTVKIDVVEASNLEAYGDIAQFIKTSEQEFIQDEDYGTPNTFRPVLKYGGNALSYNIDYTLKIFNVNTNATTEKRGAYLSFDPGKYGKSLLKINTRDSIKIFDVFNKKTIKNFNTAPVASESTNIQDTSLYNKNITSFKEATSVYSGINNVSIDADGKIVPTASPDTVDNVQGNGKATVYLSPFDTFLQFNMYEQKDNDISSIDLTKVGETFLNFTNKNGEIIKIPNTNNTNVVATKGQVLFRIKPAIYNQIINSGNDIFYITSKVGENTPETLMYSGSYLDYAASEIDKEKQALIEKQRQTIQDLNGEIEALNNNVEVEIEKRVSAFRKAITEQETSTNEKDIDDASLVVKSSPFNPYGPTSVISLTSSGPTA